MILSEFNIKGAGIISIKKFLNHEYGVGYFEKKWEKYFPDYSNGITDTSWYPMESLVNCLLNSSIEVDADFKEYVSKMYNNILWNDLNEINKSFMRSAGIKKILFSSPQLIKSYLNCQEMNILENRTGFFRYEMTSAEFASDWHLYGQEGIMNGILGICGKKIKEFNIQSRITFSKNNLKFTKTIIEFLYE